MTSRSMLIIWLPYGIHIINILLDVIHLVHSRSMTSHHVTSHVTSVTCLFIINKKEKEIQKKRNIKSRKMDKRKRKMLVSKCIITYNLLHNKVKDLLDIQSCLLLLLGICLKLRI